MEDLRRHFWLTCPYCHKRFSLAPQIVLKYVDRLFSQLGQEIEEQGRKLKAKRDPEPPANLPVAEE